MSIRKHIPEPYTFCRAEKCQPCFGVGFKDVGKYFADRIGEFLIDIVHISNLMFSRGP